MRFAFKELPGSPDGFARPVLGVRVAGQDVAYGCLVDTGSIANRFASWVADAAGIDRTEGQHERLAVGGVVTRAVTVPVDLVIEDMRWRAPVAFCDPWPFGFHLLGQEGFFRFFRVLITASDYSLELEADLGSANE
jgi:hypothetical protein